MIHYEFYRFYVLAIFCVSQDAKVNVLTNALLYKLPRDLSTGKNSLL